MTAITWSITLGVLSTLVWLLGVFGHARLSAWLLIAIQVPWTVWDIATGNYGFLLLTATSLLAGTIVLMRGNNVTGNN